MHTSQRENSIIITHYLYTRKTLQMKIFIFINYILLIFKIKIYLNSVCIFYSISILFINILHMNTVK